jgi:hypothetical protein
MVRHATFYPQWRIDHRNWYSGADLCLSEILQQQLSPDLPFREYLLLFGIITQKK